ncbi:hypothetical protein BKA61DRAFT_656573 [Leptodontidium sp. MPI-SDFR-AT-0119]|nr:hypothetical protein BKA61DRAFT_656573 [Leptodontidium sp. MPI-SDFR-AT-0119]
MQLQMDNLPRCRGPLTTDLGPEPFPNNALPSNALFLEQCTDPCFNLPPQQLNSCSASTSPLVSSGLRASSLNSPAFEGSLSSPGLPDTGIVGAGRDSPEAFFTAVLTNSEERQEKRANRVKRLARVVRNFSRAEAFDGLCINSSRWSDIFLSKSEASFEAGSRPETTFEIEVANRLHRLKQSGQKIRKGDWQARRIWLICVAHELECISQWEDIDRYTSRGVDKMSAAIRIAKKYLGTAGGDRKKGRSIIQVMEEGGPAAVLLDDGDMTRSDWESNMPISDITSVYAFKKDKLPDLDKKTRSRDPDASDAIKNCFLSYGWSFEKLLCSNTVVVAILKRYLLQKRPHAGSGLGDPESTHKRRRVDPGHNSLATSSDQLAIGYSDSNHAASAEIDNNVDYMPGSASSNRTPFGIRDGTRDLTDAATISNLEYTFHTSDELTDAATADILSHTVSSLGEFTDLPTSNLGYITNSSGAITDLNTGSLFQSIHGQPLSQVGYETDESAVELLRWTVNRSDALIDQPTDMFLRGAISPSQLYGRLHLPVS